MKLKKPKFWDLKKPNLLAVCLLPLSILFELFSALRIKSYQEFPNIKKICIGNIYLGGTGKTSLALKVHKLLKQRKIKSCFIKKFYTNQEDEQKILSKHGELFSAENRLNALQKAITKKYKFAIFDDGLQDKNIKYDVNFVCFNNINWIGNGLMIPAGPLRENIKELKKYKNVVINGNLENISNLKKKLKKINKNIVIHVGKYMPIGIDKFDLNEKYLAFSGIGNHKTFISMLKENNFKVIKDLEFPDHYHYHESDIEKILKMSNELNCKLITTEKDIQRIKNKNKINYIRTELNILNEKKLLNAIFEINE